MESVRAKCFIKSMEAPSEPDIQIAKVEKELTVLTFTIKNSVKLVINFKVDNFRHRVYLKIG